MRHTRPPPNRVPSGGRIWVGKNISHRFIIVQLRMFGKSRDLLVVGPKDDGSSATLCNSRRRDRREGLSERS